MVYQTISEIFMSDLYTWWISVLFRSSEILKSERFPMCFCFISGICLILRDSRYVSASLFPAVTASQAMEFSLFPPLEALQAAECQIVRQRRLDSPPNPVFFECVSMFLQWFPSKHGTLHFCRHKTGRKHHVRQCIQFPYLPNRWKYR